MLIRHDVSSGLAKRRSCEHGSRGEDEGAARLIGKKLQIEKTSFMIAGRQCSPPTYEEKTQTRSEYYEGYEVTGNPLSLPSTIKVIDASCTLLVPEGPNRLVVGWKGFFFEATRIRK